MGGLDTFAQVVLNGLLLGGIYALVAFGLSLIYGVSRVLNLTHGTFLMLAGILASGLYAWSGWNPFFIALVLAPLFFVLGGLFWGLLVRPNVTRTPLEFVIGSVLITVGLMMVIEDTSLFVAGPNLHSIPYRPPEVRLGPVAVGTARTWILACILVLTIALHLFLWRSYLGKGLRAITEDYAGALLSGVDVARLNVLSFGLGLALVAVAGVFYDMVFAIGPYMGFPLTVTAFTVIILGGIGSLVGSLLGGLILGLAETGTAYVLGAKWAPAISVVTLLVILVVRPQGLLGHRLSHE